MIYSHIHYITLYITHIANICVLFLTGCPPLSPGDIISSHAVEPSDQVICNYRCFKEPKCVGYNFRSQTNDKSMINCQLTNITKSKNDTKEYKGDWMLFYEVYSVSNSPYFVSRYIS